MNDLIFLETNKPDKIVIIDAEDFDLIKLHNRKILLSRLQGGCVVVYSSVYKKSVHLHRLIMSRPFDDGWDIDHKNLNPLDNRKTNLRLATFSQNRINRNKPKGTYSSKYKNISWSARDKIWIVATTKNGKKFHGGCFSDEIEAAKHADFLLKKYHGEFARLNFP